LSSECRNWRESRELVLPAVIHRIRAYGAVWPNKTEVEHFRGKSGHRHRTHVSQMFLLTVYGLGSVIFHAYCLLHRRINLLWGINRDRVWNDILTCSCFE
jgi:hypothetical protein